MQDMAGQQKSFFFFFLLQLQFHLRILLRLAVRRAKSPPDGRVTSMPPPCTTSSQLNLACLELTGCFFAISKHLLTKPRDDWRATGAAVRLSPCHLPKSAPRLPAPPVKQCKFQRTNDTVHPKRSHSGIFLPVVVSRSPSQNHRITEITSEWPGALTVGGTTMVNCGFCLDPLLPLILLPSPVTVPDLLA